MYISEHKNGLKYKEIAEKYGVTEVTVRSAIYRYKHKLDSRRDGTDFHMGSEPPVKVKEMDEKNEQS